MEINTSLCQGKLINYRDLPRTKLIHKGANIINGKWAHTAKWAIIRIIKWKMTTTNNKTQMGWVL